METGKWIKFSNGTGGSNCVEVQRGYTGVVMVRDSERPDGEVLIFTPAQWESFLEGVRAGTFDL